MPVCLALTRAGLVPVRTGPRVFLENPSGLPLDSEVTACQRPVALWGAPTGPAPVLSAHCPPLSLWGSRSAVVWGDEQAQMRGPQRFWKAHHWNTEVPGEVVLSSCTPRKRRMLFRIRVTAELPDNVPPLLFKVLKVERDPFSAPHPTWGLSPFLSNTGSALTPTFLLLLQSASWPGHRHPPLPSSGQLLVLSAPVSCHPVSSTSGLRRSPLLEP